MNNLFYFNDYDNYIDLIKNDIHFKYSRFNDGELIAISGKTPNDNNCDGHKYFPEMSLELKNILLNYKSNDHYILESFDHWYYNNNLTKQVLDELKIENPELSFLSSDFIRILHEKFPIKFKLLLDVLKTKKLIIVAPEYLDDLSKFFTFDHIKVPLVNSYHEKEVVISKIREINNNSSNNYYLFSASMPSNIIIDAFKEDTDNTYINWGSVWDTFFVGDRFNFIRKRSTSNNDIVRGYYSEYLIM